MHAMEILGNHLIFFKNCISQKFDFERLEVQLTMSPDFMKTVNLQNASQGHVVMMTTISTGCDMMNNFFFAKSMISEVHKLLRIYLTLPGDQQLIFVLP